MKHTYRVVVSGPDEHVKGGIAEQIKSLIKDDRLIAWSDKIQEVVVEEETRPADYPHYSRDEVARITQQLYSQCDKDHNSSDFVERFDQLVNSAISVGLLPPSARPKVTALQMRLRELQARLQERGVRGLAITWTPEAQGAGIDARGEGLIRMMESYLDGEGTPVALVGDELASCAYRAGNDEQETRLPLLSRPSYPGVKLMSMNEAKLTSHGLNQSHVERLLCETERILGTPWVWKSSQEPYRQRRRLPVSSLSHAAINLRLEATDEEVFLVGDIVILDTEPGRFLADQGLEPTFHANVRLAHYADVGGYVGYVLHSTYTFTSK